MDADIRKIEIGIWHSKRNRFTANVVLHVYWMQEQHISELKRRQEWLKQQEP